jgi:hypothetical protein
MDVKHDALRHLRYLRQSLAQDNEAVGVLLSAGCPLAVDMPPGKWPLIPDVANLTKAIHSDHTADVKYQHLLSELAKAGKNVENIEEVLSFVRSLAAVASGGDVRGLNEGDLIHIQKLICDSIVGRLDVELPNQETPYNKLCKWIKSIDRKVAVEAFTTNYDLLLEQALENNRIAYFDGFVGARKSFFDLHAVEEDLVPRHWTKLWKLHGSINWHQSSVAGSTQVHRSSEVKTSSSHLIYPSHLKYDESRKMPYLALMDQLGRFLRRKSAFLVLCGYSFNDGHVNDTIINALSINPTAMVLALQYGKFAKPDGSETYPNAYKLARAQHNLNVWTFDKAIIGTNIGSWTKTAARDEDEAALEPFVAGLEVRLGDFKTFSEFLQSIIGFAKDREHG